MGVCADVQERNGPALTQNMLVLPLDVTFVTVVLDASSVVLDASSVEVTVVDEEWQVYEEVPSRCHLLYT